MFKIGTWLACAVFGLQTLQAAPEISVQRWEGEELTSTGGVEPVSDNGPSWLTIPWIMLDQPQCAPGQVRPIAFTVKNTGDEALTGLVATLSGADQAAFVVSHALPPSLAPGASARVVVSFAPQVKRNMAAMLTLSSNDEDEGAFTISLLATSHVTGPVLRIKEVGVGEVRPLNSLFYPRVPTPAASEVSGGSTLILTNDGNADLVNLQAISTSGVSASLPATSLAPGASLAVQVVNNGFSSGGLTFEANSGGVRFELAVKSSLVLIGRPGSGVVIGPGPGITPITPIIVNPPIIFPNPNVSGPVSFAFSWRLGESDVGAQAGGALTATKLDAFAASGTINVNVSQTVTGSPAYADTADTPAATKVQSRLGAHFDGTSKITSGLTLGLPDNLAVEAWARPQSTTGTQALVYCGTAGTNGFGIYQVDGVLRGRLGGVGDLGEASFAAGEWVHVALVRKAGVATFYVNGQAAGASVTDAFVAASSGGITAGGTPAGTDLFTGDLDEVRWMQIGTGFDPAQHLLHAQNGPALYVSVDHQSNPAINGPVSFGSLTTNSSRERVIYVTNRSFATVPALSVSLLGDHLEDFELRDPLNPIELRPYVTASVRIRFAPQALGTHTATARISSGMAGTSPIDVALTGEGVPPPEIEVVDSTGAPLPNGSAAVNFGPAPEQRTITIKNTGEGPLLNLSAYLDGSGYAFTLSSLPDSLAAGTSADLTITHTAMDASGHQATLRLLSSDTDEGYYSIAIHGQGQPRLAVELPGGVPLEHGVDVVGTSGPQKSVVVLRNTGASDLQRVSLGFTGPQASEFTVVAAPPTNIAAGQSATVEIAFTPGGDGIRSAMLRVASSDLAQPSFAVALVGRGDLQSELRVQVVGQTNALVPGQLVAMPASAVGKTSSLLLEVTNPSGTVPTLVPVLEGSNPADFAVTLVSRSRTRTGDKATYRVTFKPSQAGERSAGARLQSGATNLTAFSLTVAGWGLVKPQLPIGPATMVMRLGDSTTFHPIPIMVFPAVILPWPGRLVYPPDDTYQWRKNGVPIKGEAQSFIALEATSLNIAGTYSIAASNAAGTTVTDVLRLAVMDPALQGGELAGVGKPFTMTVRAAGPEVKYQWFADSLPLDGETKATLTVQAASPAQVSYYCEVKCGSEEQLSEALNVKFVAPAVVTGPTELTLTAHGLVDVPLTVEGTATRFGASGLPPGLILNSYAGSIEGAATTPGVYQAKFWAMNPAGKGPVLTVPLVVNALLPDLVGNFMGSAARNENTEDMGGFLQLTVSSTATFTGRLTLGRQSWPLAGRLPYSGETDISAIDLPLGTATEPGQGFLDLTVTQDQGVSAMAKFYSEGRYIAVIASRQRPAIGQAGRYNAGIATNDLQRNITTPVPEGRGFVSLLVNAAGAVTASGRTADGAAFTSSTGVTNAGVPFFSLLYGGAGSVLGRMDLTGEDCGGLISWSKKTRPDDASFPEGWNTLYAQATGSRYRAPAAGARLLGAPVRTPNGVIVFSGGDLSDPVTMPLTLSQSAARPAPLATSPKSFSMSIHAATGQFSGTCLLGTPGQSTSFHGLIVPSADEGIGQFMRGPQKISGNVSLR